MSLVQLTLTAPRHLEDELVEQLLAHPEWAAGFTLFQTEGHSTHTKDLSATERVRARVHRLTVQIVLEVEQAQALLSHLSHHLPKSDVAYWLAPVIDFGRLT